MMLFHVKGRGESFYFSSGMIDGGSRMPVIMPYDGHTIVQISHLHSQVSRAEHVTPRRGTFVKPGAKHRAQAGDSVYRRVSRRYQMQCQPNDTLQAL